MMLYRLSISLEKSPAHRLASLNRHVKLTFAVLCLSIITGCKKSSTKPTPNYSGIIAGRWSGYNFTTNAILDISANVSQFPCIANNVMTFNTDNTEVRTYVGNDTCYLAKIPAQQANLIVGEAGQAPTNSTWTVHGNLLYLDFNGGIEIGTISLENNVYHLDFRDTIRSGPNVIISDTGYIKE